MKAEVWAAALVRLGDSPFPVGPERGKQARRDEEPVGWPRQSGELLPLETRAAKVPWKIKNVQIHVKAVPNQSRWLEQLTSQLCCLLPLLGTRKSSEPCVSITFSALSQRKSNSNQQGKVRVSRCWSVASDELWNNILASFCSASLLALIPRLAPHGHNVAATAPTISSLHGITPGRKREQSVLAFKR